MEGEKVWMGEWMGWGKWRGEMHSKKAKTIKEERRRT